MTSNVSTSLPQPSVVHTTLSTILETIVSISPSNLSDFSLTTSQMMDANMTSSLSSDDVVPFLSSSNTTTYSCDGRWLPVNHLYFQLANLFLFLSYLAPNGIYGILYLRITLCIGCFFFSLWGYLVLCAMDTILWNAIFVVINLLHAIYIAYKLRPVRFSEELEQVYRELFLPLRVSRSQYKRALDCMKLIRHVRFQEIYAQEKITRVDSLSLVISGRLVISQHGKALHIVSQHQFLDSPEWFGVSSDEFFQVSATAIEDSRVLIWHRDKLKLSISNDPFLVSVFDHILGRDVVKKLMQVNESMRNSHHALNGRCGGADLPGTVLSGAPAGTPSPVEQVVEVDLAAPPPSGEDLNSSHNSTNDSKPLLVTVKKAGANGITSMLSKHIPDEEETEDTKMNENDPLV